MLPNQATGAVEIQVAKTTLDRNPPFLSTVINHSNLLGPVLCFYPIENQLKNHCFVHFSEEIG